MSNLEKAQKLSLSDYQKRCCETAIYPKEKGMGLYYCALGLSGEAGEIANKIKKVMRDASGSLAPERREQLSAELGDVLWYIASLCTELGVDMSDVAQRNIDKLNSRLERGVIGGDGDNR